MRVHGVGRGGGGGVGGDGGARLTVYAKKSPHSLDSVERSLFY